MPTRALKGMAKHADVSLAAAEHKWEKAKSIVRQEYDYSEDDSHFWALVTSITKRMLGLKESISFKEFLKEQAIHESTSKSVRVITTQFRAAPEGAGNWRWFFQNEFLFNVEYKGTEVWFTPYATGGLRYHLPVKTFEKWTVSKEQYHRRFLDDLKEDSSEFEQYVCIEPCGFGPRVWFEVGDVILAKREGQCYRVKFNNIEFKWWHTSVDECFFKGTLNDYRRKFLDELKEESMSAVDFIKNVFAKNYAKHMKTDIKEVHVSYKKTAYAEKKQCYNNAMQYLIIENPNAKYVLGFTFVHGIPIEHAWIKENEKYYDVTLADAAEETFVTLIELDSKQVMQFFKKHHFGPTLWDVTRSGIGK
jgi:hypothetical protein